jgi:hypothetical protein
MVISERAGAVAATYASTAPAGTTYLTIMASCPPSRRYR